MEMALIGFVAGLRLSAIAGMAATCHTLHLAPPALGPHECTSLQCGAFCPFIPEP